MSDRTIPRKSSRHPVVLTAACRSQSGLRDTGSIADISAEGCSIASDGMYFQVGTRVLVRPEGMEGMTGVVRWIRGIQAGIEFDAPIYGPVLDHIVASAGNEEAGEAG